MKKRIVIPFMLFLIFATLVNAAELCENMVEDTELEVMWIEDPSRVGEDEWTWAPNENITIEVRVKNENYTERDFEVKLFLLAENYDVQENFTTSDNDIIKTVSLDIEESETIEFSFQLEEMEAEDYFLYAKFYDKVNESRFCTELRARDEGDEIIVEMKDKKRLIVIKKIYGPKEIIPGSTIEYTAEVINLGNTDEGQILVKVYNSALQLNQEEEISGLAMEEMKNITFGFTAPDNLTKEQQIIFAVEYDYNNATGNYEEFSDNNNIFTIEIKQNATTPKITNETAPLTTEQNTTPPEAEESSAAKGTEEPINLLWITIPSTLLIIIIAIVVFYFTRRRSGVPPVSPATKVKKYVEKINGGNSPTPPTKTAPNPPTPQGKPSGNYTSDTKIPPTSQNPSQAAAHSPPHPSKASSSPKPKPASTPASPPAPQEKPQKSPPSQTPPKPNKTSQP